MHGNGGSCSSLSTYFIEQIVFARRILGTFEKLWTFYRVLRVFLFLIDGARGGAILQKQIFGSTPSSEKKPGPVLPMGFEWRESGVSMDFREKSGTSSLSWQVVVLVSLQCA